MKILVAGSAGFIGRHLSDSLEVAGHEVVRLDSLYTHIRDLPTHPDTIQMDIRDVREDNLPRGINLIYNLACPAAPDHYQRDPVDTILTNVEGTKSLLQIAALTGSPFVQASTSEVYGSQTNVMHEEDWGHVNPVGPRSCYDEGKRCAEALIVAWHRQKKSFPAIICRLFNVYGPGMSLSDGRMLPNFISQAIEGKPLTVYGDGSQTRSCCYIDDMVVALGAAGTLIKAKQMYPEGKRPWGNDVPIMNLGSNAERRVIDIAEMVLGLSDSDQEIIKVGLPQDDPPARKPSLARAAAWLGWEATTPLREGIGRMLDDYAVRMENWGGVAR